MSVTLRVRPRPRLGAKSGDASELVVVCGGESPANVHEGIELAQLDKSHRRLDVGEVVFEAESNCVAEDDALRPEALPSIPGKAVQAQDVHAFGELRVVGRDHSTFARRDVLVGIEAEARNSGRAD